ncbi:MAG: hypothetical protein AAF411_00045 [Myxococcota bacterium]
MRLIFVYNVDATPAALLRDLVQGIRTGQTDCHLCDITYGKLLKDRRWNRFVQGLPLDVDFLMRSAFRRRYPMESGPFPAAYIKDGATLRCVIDAVTMNAFEDVTALREHVARVVAELGS